MKKIVLLVLLAGAALLLARRVPAWRAQTVYEKFADAWTRGDLERARKYATEDAARRALENRSLRGLRSGAMMEALRGTRYSIESQTSSPAGDLELEVQQTILFDPPGVTTAIGGAMVTHIRHSVTLREMPDGWRVVDFEPAFIDMFETRRR